MSELQINKSGDIEVDSRERLYAAAEFCIRTEIAPQTLRSKGVAAVSAAILLCKQLGLSFKAMNNMYYIRGQIQFFGYLINTIALKSPRYDKTKYFFLNKEGEIITYKNKNLHTEIEACVYLIKTKDNDEWNEYFYTKEMAKKAGLLQNQTYNKYIGDMLMHRAKARALFQEFPDVLNGVISKDASEIHDIEFEDAKELDKANYKKTVDNQLKHELDEQQKEKLLKFENEDKLEKLKLDAENEHFAEKFHD